ncbi:MAG: DEAD/DEAH box helicase [Opitutia bacterium]
MAAKSPLPNITEDDLIDLAGGATVLQAKALVRGGKVRKASWNAPVVEALVEEERGSREARWNLRSVTFQRNECGCEVSVKQRKVCIHSVAAYLALAVKEGRMKIEEEKPAPAAETPAAPAADKRTAPDAAGGPRLRSISLSNRKGTPIEVRFIVPPNIATAAQRDEIICRLELRVEGTQVAPENLDRGKAWNIEPETVFFLAILENLCNGRLQGILPLTRRHLRQLLSIGRGLGIFRMANAPDAPLAWEGDRLAGVHAHLEEPEAPAPKAPATDPEDGEEEQEVRSTERGREDKVWLDGSMKWLRVRLPQQSSGPVAELREVLKRTGFTLETATREWYMAGTIQVLNFLARHHHLLLDQNESYFSHNLSNSLAKVQLAKARCDASEAEGGFNFAVGIDPEGKSPKVVQEALSSGRMFFYTDHGPRLITPELLESIRNAQRRITGDAKRDVDLELELKIGYADLASADAIAEELQVAFAPPETWSKRSDAIRNLSKLQPAPMRAELGTVLRLYQQVGVAWLWHIHTSNLGGLLADEMGLGKTVQALAFMEALRNHRREDGPCLVVCPASLVENWRREAKRFTPSLRTLAHHGQQRVVSQEYLGKFDLVITSYGTLARDVGVFSLLSWGAVTCDEGQNIKNPRSQAAKSVKQLIAKGRYILTGTPVENSLDDLRSLFGFLMPGYLPKAQERLTGEDRKWHDDRLLRMAAPYILRRSKAAVAPELPPKIEQLIYCDLEDAQKKLYDEVQETISKEIFEMEVGGAKEKDVRMQAFKLLTRLRQTCADPRILDPKLEETDSAKLQALLELLEESKDAGHRLLVFSTFVSALQLIREALEERDIPFCYLDGSTTDRQGVCDKFNGTPSIPVMLMSLKAGGTGLNLTGADTVVHFDPWWNPAAEAQATDRAHRIGQTRTVTSIKLIAANTIEERVMDLQKGKSEMLRKLLSESDSVSSSLSLADIKELLRKD